MRIQKLDTIGALLEVQMDFGWSPSHPGSHSIQHAGIFPTIELEIFQMRSASECWSDGLEVALQMGEVSRGMGPFWLHPIL